MFLRNELKLTIKWPFPVTNISEDEVSGGVAKVAVSDGIGSVEVLTSAVKRSIGEVVQSRRRPLLGPSPG